MVGVGGIDLYAADAGDREDRLPVLGDISAVRRRLKCRHVPDPERRVGLCVRALQDDRADRGRCEAGDGRHGEDLAAVAVADRPGRLACHLVDISAAGGGDQVSRREEDGVVAVHGPKKRALRDLHVKKPLPDGRGGSDPCDAPGLCQEVEIAACRGLRVGCFLHPVEQKGEAFEIPGKRSERGLDQRALALVEAVVHLPEHLAQDLVIGVSVGKIDHICISSIRSP